MRHIYLPYLMDCSQLNHLQKQRIQSSNILGHIIYIKNQLYIIIDAILHVQSQPIQDQKSMHIVVYLK